MKTKMLFSLLIGILVLGVFPGRADGWLQFANAPSASALVYERDPVTLALTPVPAGAAKVEFLYAPVGTTDFDLFHTVAGESPVGIIFNGRFSGGTYRLNDIEPGAVVSALVRGWTGPFATWGEAVNSGTAAIGISSLFLVDTTDPAPIPPPPPANIINSVPGQGFAGLILQVPEPASLALCGFGLGSLFAFRRRSKSNA
jgi:hypothetical protein